MRNRKMEGKVSVDVDSCMRTTRIIRAKHYEFPPPFCDDQLTTRSMAIHF